MAKMDIRPFTGPLGGTHTVRWGSMTAGEVFEMGEPVMVVNAGTVSEPVGATTTWTIGEFTSAGESCEGGIACFGPGATNINPATGIAFATGDDVAFWPINEGNLFITDNFFATGDTTTAVVPAQTDVGEGYRMNQAAAATAWGIEQTAAVAGANVVANVTEVLDSMFRPIRLSGQAGVYLVFFITATTTAP